MSYEMRSGKRVYYHRTKVNGRVISRYLGTGVEGEAIDRAVQARKADGANRRKQLADLRAQIADEEQPFIDFHNTLDLLYSNFKVSEGYHKHLREWRKTGPLTRRTLLVDKSQPIDIFAIEKAAAAELERRARASGDVKAFIDQYKGHADKNAVEHLLHVSSLPESTKTAYRLKVEELKKSLAGPEPSALVEIMATRVAIGWLDTYTADSVFYLWADGQDIERATYYDKRRGRAARRLLQAVKCLSDIQRVAPAEIHSRLPRFEIAGRN